MWVPLCIWGSKAIKECSVLFFLGNRIQTASNFLVPWENCSVEYKTFIILQCYQTDINITYKLTKKPQKTIELKTCTFVWKQWFNLCFSSFAFSTYTFSWQRHFQSFNSKISSVFYYSKWCMLKWKTEHGEDRHSGKKTLRFRLAQEIRHACSFVKSASSELCTIIKSSGIIKSYL